MGKSSVIQALLVLRQSIESGDLLDGRLVLGGELSDLGTGTDVLFEDAQSDVIGFEIESDEIEKTWALSFDCSQTTRSVNVHRGKFKPVNATRANGLARGASIWTQSPVY